MASSSIRSARSRISGEYFWFIVFHPCFKNGTKPRPIQQVTDIEGFGTFPSGLALREKFAFKATGTDQSLDAVLKEHIETVKLIQQVVAKSIANLTETDQNTGQQVTKTGQDIPQG
ncbi:hypothetical protein IU457_29215 [Nocardia cyriacigeorgica]|nr:hypothetical protein [Nocardia cyriacigeorgica]